MIARYATVQSRLTRLDFFNLARLCTVHVAVVCLVLSAYTYHAARLIAPLLGLGLVYLWWRKKKFKDWWQLASAGFLGLILMLPLLLSLTKTTTTQRFAETSLFSDITLIEESNLRKKRANNTFLSRLFYHRYLLYGREIVGNYLDYFNLDFLILSGDSNPRHSVQMVGTFYHLELLFLLLGAYALFKNKIRLRYFLLFWLLVGIFPAALTKTNPHALRILPTLPVWIVMITLGLNELLTLVSSWKKIIIPLIALIYLAEISLFWRFYTRVYPQLYASHWQVGAKEYVLELAERSQQQPEGAIKAEDKFGRTMMFYWFYNQTDPKKVQAVNEEVKKDQGEFMEFGRIKLF